MRVTNELGLPQPFVSAAEQEHAYKPGRYSVTSLLKGTRECLLSRRHADEITQDASDMVWAVFGRAVHSILEDARETDTQLKENYVVVPVGEYEVSGIFDLYDDATGTVTDYKTASVWKAMRGDFSDWRRQTLCYCWMLRQLGFDARRGEAVMLLKDHSKREARVKDGYPPHPVAKVSWGFDESDIEECGRWVEGRLAAIAAAESLEDDELPLCTAEERWSRGEVWAVKRKGLKRAVKLYDSEVDARCDAAARQAREGRPYEVEHRPGEDTKCEGYCAACTFCSHYRDIKGE